MARLANGWCTEWRKL